MNTNMYENPIVQDNIEKLKRFGMEIVEPDVGIWHAVIPEPENAFETVLLDYI